MHGHAPLRAQCQDFPLRLWRSSAAPASAVKLGELHNGETIGECHRIPAATGVLRSGYANLTKRAQWSWVDVKEFKSEGCVENRVILHTKHEYLTYIFELHLVDDERDWFMFVDGDYPDLEDDSLTRYHYNTADVCVPVGFYRRII